MMSKIKNWLFDSWELEDQGWTIGHPSYELATRVELEAQILGCIYTIKSQPHIYPYPYVIITGRKKLAHNEIIDVNAISAWRPKAPSPVKEN